MKPKNVENVTGVTAAEMNEYIRKSFQEPEIRIGDNGRQALITRFNQEVGDPFVELMDDEDTIGYCFFCGAWREPPSHKDDCLWLAFRKINK